MIEYIGRYAIEDNTGKSTSPFWVYIDNGCGELVASEYFRDYETALEWVLMQEGDY